MGAPLLSPVEGWQIDATSRLVVLRISTERSSDFSVAARDTVSCLNPSRRDR
jgi:hypothetical protein